MANNSSYKQTVCYKMIHGVSGFMDSLEQPQQRKMDMRFGTRNVGSLYRAGSLTTVAREIARYKLDLVEVQEVR
jgi:hypothetical protein